MVPRSTLLALTSRRQPDTLQPPEAAETKPPSMGGFAGDIPPPAPSFRLRRRRRAVESAPPRDSSAR